mmetsp:Transcript_6794/g.6028  ORF Transcript_6794/g.6028 Transcript_6794/m.6028 type:complete len:90 (-) Transcript_6794:174-443(-)
MATSDKPSIPEVMSKIYNSDSDSDENKDAVGSLQDSFEKYQNDEKFQRVSYIAEKIELTQPLDSDIDEVVSYLKTLSGLKGKFDQLNKN